MNASASAPLRSPRRTFGEFLALSALCALAYFIGPDDHGVTNWQEGIRLLAAREMQDSGSWAVPTIHGEPYLAKPPLVYWCQLALAKITGSPVALVHLRLTVAIAGWLGVVATWWAARHLLRDQAQSDPDIEGGERWAGRAAFWAGAMTATGIITARSARIGELDILLVAPTVLAVLGAFQAQRSSRARSAARAWAWTLLGAAAMVAAALAKGPPGMLTGAVAIFAGCWVDAVRSSRPTPKSRWVCALVMFIAAIALAIYRWPESIKEVAGVALFIAFAGIIAAMIARTASREAARTFLANLARSRWPILIIAGLLALAAWGRFVTAAAPDAASAAVSKEFSENLTPLVPEAPVRGVEVLAYGAGLGSICAIIALVWFVRDRPRMPIGIAWAFAWVVGALIVFTVGGRGTHRYLLPALPGVAIIGASWLASWLRDRAPRPMPAILGAAVLAVALIHGWWYGAGRDTYFADRSPRDFIAELRATPEFAGATIASWEFWKPGVEVYARTPVEMLSDRNRPMEYPCPPVPRAEVRDLIDAAGGRAIILARSDDAFRRSETTATQEIRALGLDVRDLGIAAPFLIDRDRVSIVALEVRIVP